MLKIIGIKATSWDELFKNWWQLILVGFILISVGIGTTFILGSAGLKFYRWFIKVRSKANNVPSAAKVYLATLSAAFPGPKVENKFGQPTSYGIYLGGFQTPLTKSQSQLLGAWDLLILDPYQQGVVETISSGIWPTSQQYLARIDMVRVLGDNTQCPIKTAADMIVRLVDTSASISGTSCKFTGTLISDWEKHLSTAFMKELILFISSIGLSVYLEVAAPSFLSDPAVVECKEVTGLLIRNGTISSNGEERDAFQMAKMRTTIKAFVTQACMRYFVVLACEILDDNISPSNAIIKRSYQWSRFYSALVWIGSKSALMSAELCLGQKEPLGAFDWLKELRVMEFHESWRKNNKVCSQYLPQISKYIDQLDSLFSIGSADQSTNASMPLNQNLPRLNEKAPNSASSSRADSMSMSPSYKSTMFADMNKSISSQAPIGWLSVLDQKLAHPISSSRNGSSYDYLGCFSLGATVSRRAFLNVVRSQQQLRDMKLLDESSYACLNQMGQRLRCFCDALATQDSRYETDWLAAIQELANQLLSVGPDVINLIRVYIGLDSGFQIPPGNRFWAVYSIDEDCILSIYVSRNAQNLLETILHTFLSSRGCPRHECFKAEIAFSHWFSKIVNESAVPKRLLRDIDLLSTSELLQFLQTLALSPTSNDPLLIQSIRDACEIQLLDSTDLIQLREISTSGYLSGQTSARELVASRIQWYQQYGCRHVAESVALNTFLRTYASVTQILRQRQILELQSITENLSCIISQGRIDSRVDLIALSVFCAMRRHAFEEAYLEVCDRNTLFNDQSDQAAAFAELFATGARCEAYFDMTPSALGKLLSNRYRTYHHKPGHEPPIWSDTDPSTPSAYAAAKIDVDPHYKKTSMSAHQRFTFLSVFAIPALLDILLLTTTGKGLYLSGDMTETELKSATLGLMLSLLISGAVGTWITCGGSYYLISMAFSAMNLFVITRMVGGFAFTLMVAIVGIAIVGGISGIMAGLVFFLYLLVLTAYLILLASLANYQYPGSAFQSGRPIIVLAIPVLFISPLITMWIPNHDSLIYLCVLYTFVALLIFGVRYTGSRWTTWYLKIDKINDQVLREWYVKTRKGGNEEELAGLTEPGILKLARSAMLGEVQQSNRRFGKKSRDSLVLSLSNSYDATVFLLEWYSGYSGTPLAIPYSSTWNMQTKVALQTLVQLQTGIRLHNAFIHWRQAGDEIGCSLLYFIVALLDKWNSLLAGGKLLGLATINIDHRMPVGVALAYYLIGAVLLDFNATKLHTMTARGQNMLIGSVSSISEAVNREVRARKYLYWAMLFRYLLFHVWSLALASSLLWVFDSTKESTVLFLSYVGAYTGLLWFQYTKIFVGPRGLKPLFAAASVGIPLGQLLRYFAPEFVYSDVIALATSTWIAGILALYYARIKTKSSHDDSYSSDQSHGHQKTATQGTYHAISVPGKDPLLSQDELQVLFKNLSGIQEKYRINPETHPGLEIKSILEYAIKTYGSTQSPVAKFTVEAFPNIVNVLEQTLSRFLHRTTVIECITMAEMTDTFPEVRAICYARNGQLRIVIGAETLDTTEQQWPIGLFSQTAAELLLHSVAEHCLGFKHTDAILLESILMTSHIPQSPVSQNVRNHLTLSKSSSYEIKTLAKFYEEETLQYLALGYSLDIEWTELPRNMRELIIDRCTGQETRLTQSHFDWLAQNKAQGLPVETLIIRSNFGAYVASSNRRYLLGKGEERQAWIECHENVFDPLKVLRLAVPGDRHAHQRLLRVFQAPFSVAYHNAGIFSKLLAIAFVAEPEFQREMDCLLRSSPWLFRISIMHIATSIWIYTKFMTEYLLPIFLFKERRNISTLWKRMRGTTVALKRQRISIENTDGPSTAFIHTAQKLSGEFKIYQYSGNLKKEPNDKAKLQRISTYSKGLRLLLREDFTNGITQNIYAYEYAAEVRSSTRKRLSKIQNLPRYPILRKCIEGKNRFEEHNFNYRGLVESGSYLLHGSLVRFQCYYREASHFEDELLRAQFVLPHLSCTVVWSTMRSDQWIPSSQVMEATFVLGSDVYESRWIYDHKFHPTIITTLNGNAIATPPIIQWDHLGVLKKPTKFTFMDDDPLISFRSLRSHLVPRCLGLNIHHNPVSTSRARSRLWKAWKNLPGFDGVMVRWLDEKLLRSEPLLRPYWRRRDRGDLAAAKAFLDENIEGIMATVDLDNSISAWTPLAFKIADLYSFGQGGDANIRTRSSAPDFDEDSLHVVAVDSGTWPNEGGGVSACRRDMINNLRSVKWHMIAESANDSGLPKHQTEMNVQSLKVIPLWGLDFLTPTHGLFKDKLDSEVEHVPRDATKMDIEWNFLPILTALVKGARTSHFSKSDILQTTRALVKLNEYFSESKHWGGVWTSDIVKEAWRNLWISDNLVSPTPSEHWFQTEYPTIAQLDGALELWHRYLFIFSIPLPERIPAIFQASHHSVSASYGIVCKIKRGCTLQIWDHAISWRETNLYLSSDLCSMAPFVRNALLGLMRITSQLILHHADTILPCADFFNPGWEVEIGTSQGTLEHRNIFKRKIDPVVNGIPDMTKFAPIKEISSKMPTVTMLSHVWYAKDIKTAILAADIIVNQWGFKDYRLDIYGAVDKAPSYSTDCFEIIASKSLPKYVVMRGEANPSTVLGKTWVFLNSSISEGLPLALGEAALTGAPVVCTDVGASLRVLTDPDTGERYSAVVAPNDARNLARAQINFLALLDEWAPYAEDPEGSYVPTLSDKPTVDDITEITQRMYSKIEQRKALGMRSREIVQKSFGGERYLREHEQMLWIGKARYNILHPTKSTVETAPKIHLASLPIASDLWGTTSAPNDHGRRPPVSSIQTSSMMNSTLEASVLSTPEIKNLFDSGVSSIYGASTKSSSLTMHHAPLRKMVAARVAYLAHERRKVQYESSRESSMMISRTLHRESTFLDDVTKALEKV